MDDMRNTSAPLYGKAEPATTKTTMSVREMRQLLGLGKTDSYWLLHKNLFATVYKGNIIKNLIMDCQSYTKYRPNETTGGIFVSWRRKEELPTGGLTEKLSLFFHAKKQEVNAYGR